MKILATAVVAVHVYFTAPKPMADFRVFYAAGRAVLSGGNPYGFWEGDRWMVFRYPPSAAWLFAPLAAMPEEGAKILWLLLIDLSFLYCLREISRAWDLGPVGACLLFLSSLHFLGTQAIFGQVDFPILALLVWALRKRESPSWIRCGGLALAALPKLLPLLLLPLLWKRGERRASIRTAAIFCVLLLLPAILVPSRAEDLYRRWWRTSFQESLFQEPPLDGQSFYTVSLRHLPPPAAASVAVLLGLGLYAACLRGIPGPLQTAAALGLLVLANPRGWGHNTLYCLPAAAAGLSRGFGGDRWAGAAFGLFLLFASLLNHEVVGRTLNLFFMQLGACGMSSTFLVAVLLWRSRGKAAE